MAHSTQTKLKEVTLRPVHAKVSWQLQRRLKRLEQLLLGFPHQRKYTISVLKYYSFIKNPEPSPCCEGIIEDLSLKEDK